MWRKAKVFSAFLGNDKERGNVGFLADIVQHLNDVSIKLQGEKRTTLDLITTVRPFQKRLIYSSMFFKTNQVIFRVILGKWKQEDSRYTQFIEKLIINIAELWRLFFLKTVAADFSKPSLETDITEFSTEPKDTCTCVDQGCSGNFISTGALLGISLIFEGNNLSLTDEGGGVELRQLDTTGVEAAKIQLEVTEFQ